MKFLQKDNLPSTLTIIWATFTVLSASIMRQVYTFCITVVPKEVITVGVWLAILFLGLLTLYSVRLYKKTMLIALIPILVTLTFAFSMDIPEERVHIIKYGILGYLLFSDFSKFNLATCYKLSIFWGLLVGSVDETFQWILPYRVGDIRDVAIDTVSSVLGAVIAHSSRRALL